MISLQDGRPCEDIRWPADPVLVSFGGAANGGFRQRGFFYWPGSDRPFVNFIAGVARWAGRRVGIAEAPGSSPGDSTICVSVALSGIGIRCAFRPRSFGSSSLPARTNSSPWRNADAASSRGAAFGHAGSLPAGDINFAQLAESVDARHLKRLGRSMPVRARRCAPSSCSRRQAAKASALHADNRRFESVREYHSRAFSSAVERRRDMADAGGSIPSRRTNLRSRSSVAERSVDNRLTQVRFLTGLPTRRTNNVRSCLRALRGRP